MGIEETERAIQSAKQALPAWSQTTAKVYIWSFPGEIINFDVMH
jgi:hypothetical protein